MKVTNISIDKVLEFVLENTLIAIRDETKNFDPECRIKIDGEWIDGDIDLGFAAIKMFNFMTGQRTYWSKSPMRDDDKRHANWHILDIYHERIREQLEYAVYVLIRDYGWYWETSLEYWVEKLNKMAEAEQVEVKRQLEALTNVD